MYKSFFSFLFNLKKFFYPRYTLHLIDDPDFCRFDIKEKIYIYKFNVFNEISLLSLTYSTITKNNYYLYAIEPRDLMKIHSIEKDKQHENSELLIKEILRGNKFKIQDYNEDIATLSGHEICNNPFMIDRMKKLDIYKISYITGFSDGRDFGKNLLSSHEMEESNEVNESNVVKLIFRK